MLTKTRMKGQITKQFIGIMVVIIIGVAVVIPVINDVIVTANLTGTTATLVELLPLFSLLLFFLIRMDKRRNSDCSHISRGWHVLKYKHTV